MNTTDKLLQEVVPIAILVCVVALVVARLPKVDVGLTPQFRRRRTLNWLPLGLTYAFLYMGRYNMNGLRDANLLSPADFGNIDALGSIVYGLAFLLNGPITDRWGGRRAILIAAAGAGACNLVVGLLLVASAPHAPTVPALTLLFGINMYFQSFGAVAIVKVNASWFHLRERGTFGGIFGILISLGLYLAFDWAPKIAELTSLPWLFLSPAVLLGAFFVVCALYVRDTPADAGLAELDVQDASSGETGPRDPALTVIKRMLTNRTIMIIALISLCSGFLRQGILKWYRTFAQGIHMMDNFVYDHWGMVSCIAGICGGMFAGVISDHLFHSRRPPVAAILFLILLVGAAISLPLLGMGSTASWVFAFMMMASLGVNGILSGVASQDFGGRRNAGTATGLIDGFVYFGTAAQGLIYGHVLPQKGAAADVSNWNIWPILMIPVAAIGLAFSLSIWNARVAAKAAH
ncbi:MAG TPA: MFS transporter [Kofleriaceae bacterium]|jgi:OPA family glycerol-3-phosphate transporter-like MFS transporter